MVTSNQRLRTLAKTVEHYARTERDRASSETVSELMEAGAILRRLSDETSGEPCKGCGHDLPSLPAGTIGYRCVCGHQTNFRPTKETTAHDRRVDGWCHTCSSYTCSALNGSAECEFCENTITQAGVCLECWNKGCRSSKGGPRETTEHLGNPMPAPTAKTISEPPCECCTGAPVGPMHAPNCSSWNEACLSKPKSRFNADEALSVSDQYDYLRADAVHTGAIYDAMFALADEVRRLRKPEAVALALRERTAQPLADPKLTVEVALKEAERCRQYPDPVLNEQVIVVLANEALRMRRSPVSENDV